MKSSWFIRRFRSHFHQGKSYLRKSGFIRSLWGIEGSMFCSNQLETHQMIFDHQSNMRAQCQETVSSMLQWISGVSYVHDRISQSHPFLIVNSFFRLDWHWSVLFCTKWMCLFLWVYRCQTNTLDRNSRNFWVYPHPKNPWSIFQRLDFPNDNSSNHSLKMYSLRIPELNSR